MSKTLDAKYEELCRELVAHAESFPLGDLNKMPHWGTKFDRLRDHVERLKYAKGKRPPPTAVVTDRAGNPVR